MSSTPTHGSDTQIPGWWIASDGRWYPPETHPNYVPPAPEPPAAVTPPVAETPTYTAPAAQVTTPEVATPDVAASYTAPAADVPSYTTPTTEVPDYTLPTETATTSYASTAAQVPEYTTPSVPSVDAADAAGSVTGAVGDVAGGVTGKLGDVAGGIGDAAGGVTGKLGDAAGGVTGKLGDVAGGVTGKLGDVAGGVTGKLGDVAGGIGDKLGGGAAMAGGAAVAGAAAVGGGASGLVDKVTDRLPGAADLPELPDLSVPKVEAQAATPDIDLVDAGQAVPQVDTQPATILVDRDDAVSAIQEPVEVVTPPAPEIVEVHTPPVQATEVLAAPAPVTAHANPPEPIPGTYSSAATATGTHPVVTAAPAAPTYQAPEKEYPAPDPIIQIDKPKRRSVFAGLLALAGGALAIIGSLMEWANGTAETAGDLLYDIQVMGMDSNGLGTLIAGAVLCVIALFLLFGIGKQSFWGLLAFIAGAVIVGLAVFSFVDISGLDESHAEALRGDSRLQGGALKVVVQSAIGLWLATAGGILGVLAAPFVNRK